MYCSHIFFTLSKAPFRSSQNVGIWAWDCHLGELVLLMISVLALLGDNPMQSELACHIGMKGKFFCRMCKTQSHSLVEETSLRAWVKQYLEVSHTFNLFLHKLTSKLYRLGILD